MSRRRLALRPLAALGAAAAAVAAARPAAAVPPLASVSADVDPGALLTKLLRRATFGPTAADLARAAQLGYQGWLEEQLNPAALDDAALAARLAAYPTLGFTPAQIYTSQPTGSTATPNRPSASTCQNELTEAAILRAVASRRQLFERLVEFWGDHFNIDLYDGDCAYLKPIDDRDAIRANALGTFPALLTASMRSPAMLRYLDNITSTGTAPNENYPRELLELHTMGVGSGYTQQDVREVARCLTGWQHWSSSPSNGAQVGTLRFRADRHDAGAKTVLGVAIPARAGESGAQDAATVAAILSAHPATRDFVSAKLARWFLGDSAPAGAAASVAAAWSATGGDIKAMVRAALRPNLLADAGPKYKRPFHLVASALRALPHTLTALASLRTQLQTMGHRPFGWSPPNGYPDTTAYWSGLILPRWSYGASLLNGTSGSLAGVVIDDAAFFANAATPAAMVDRLNTALFQGELAPVERAELLEFLGAAPNRTRARESIGLALAAPSFQWY